jgi:hypothetical protein
MTKRYVTLLCITFAFVGIALWMAASAWRSNEEQMQGKLVFAQTFNLGDKVTKVKITNSKGSFELVQKNGYWLLPSKNDYYADFHLVHLLLSSFNRAMYMAQLPYQKVLLEKATLINPLEEKENAGVLIQTFVDDRLLDSIIIGAQNQQKELFFARRADKKEIWLVNGAFDLPSRDLSWLLKPLVGLPKEYVSEIVVDDKVVGREDKAQEFFDSYGQLVNLTEFFRVLSGVYAQDVMTAAQFEGIKSSVVQQRTFEVGAWHGLKFVFKVYVLGADVWFNIKLSTDRLPTTKVTDYIKENAFLYDDWYFKAVSSQANFWRSFHLN